MEEKRTDKREKKTYEYSRLPKNVRQIGVPLPGRRIYLEDYVITYLKQVFVKTDESKIVVLLGKEGREEAEEGVFCYGGIALEEPLLLEGGQIPKTVWDSVYESMRQNFPEAQIIGWACGVNVWNSEMDSRVRAMQRTEFAREDSVLFLWDLSEKEEKIFLWQRDIMKEQPGYYIYYEKNPQMQDYMLEKPETESIDAEYRDHVTSSIRHVMEEKEEHRRNIQTLTYCGVAAAGIAILFAAHLMMESTMRIKNMEKTVDALSEYVGQQKDEVEAMSRKAGSQIHQIPYESAEPEKKQEKAEKETAEQQSASVQEKRREASAQAPTATPSSSAAPAVKSTPGNQGAQGPSDTGEKQAGETMKHQSQSYIVRKGDTLSQIVWRHYHDLSYEKKVRQVNGIQDGDKIYEGQCIILPRQEYKK